MNKKLVSLFLMVCMVLSLSYVALAGSQDFTLINRTGFEIGEVYVSPNHSNDWEEDILGIDTLPNKQSVKITFDGRKETYWDIMVKDLNGNEYVWEKFNLKEISEIILYRDGKNLTAEYK